MSLTLHPYAHDHHARLLDCLLSSTFGRLRTSCKSLRCMLPSYAYIGMLPCNVSLTCLLMQSLVPR
jgi:hypothetical protein